MNLCCILLICWTIYMKIFTSFALNQFNQTTIFRSEIDINVKKKHWLPENYPNYRKISIPVFLSLVSIKIFLQNNAGKTLNLSYCCDQPFQCTIYEKDQRHLIHGKGSLNTWPNLTKQIRISNAMVIKVATSELNWWFLLEKILFPFETFAGKFCE